MFYPYTHIVLLSLIWGRGNEIKYFRGGVGKEGKGFTEPSSGIRGRELKSTRHSIHKLNMGGGAQTVADWSATNFLFFWTPSLIQNYYTK